LTAPFENVLFKPDIGEQGAQALSERFSFLRLVPNGIAQYFAYFLRVVSHFLGSFAFTSSSRFRTTS
jgi:hypothetical protein